MLLEKRLMAHILIIDDEKHIRAFYEESLIESGYKVSLAGSAEEALDYMTSVKFDLAILDIKLGDTNGLDLLQQINRQFKDLPVILCSAYDSFREDQKAAAAIKYVVKSFDLSELKRTISGVLDKEQGRNNFPK
jgi:DNA-binding NtrC family response regulator